MQSTDPLDCDLFERYQAAERRFGEARARRLTHKELLPFLIEANKAWRECYVPRLRERTKQQEETRRLATDAIRVRLGSMTEEERRAVFQVFGIH